MANRLPATYLDKVMTEQGIANQRIADLCHVSVNAARQWRLGLYFPSVEYAKVIASTYGIARHLLRPDIWDPPPGWKPSAEPATVAMAHHLPDRLTTPKPVTGTDLRDARTAPCAQAGVGGRTTITEPKPLKKRLPTVKPKSPRKAKAARPSGDANKLQTAKPPKPRRKPTAAATETQPAA